MNELESRMAGSPCVNTVSPETTSSETSLALEGPDPAEEHTGVEGPHMFRNCRLAVVGRTDAGSLVRASWSLWNSTFQTKKTLSALNWVLSGRQYLTSPSQGAHACLFLVCTNLRKSCFQECALQVVLANDLLWAETHFLKEGGGVLSENKNDSLHY